MPMQAVGPESPESVIGCRKAVRSAMVLERGIDERRRVEQRADGNAPGLRGAPERRRAGPSGTATRSGAPRVLPLTEDEVVIGRSEGVAIRIPSSSVSRRHARIIRDGPVLSITDLDSQNGVLVNGTAVHSAVLCDRDQLRNSETPCSSSGVEPTEPAGAVGL